MSNLTVDERNGVGRIALHRTEAMNALSLAFCAEIDAALRALENAPDVRAVLITSALKHFCAGADIREMSAMTGVQARATGFVGCVKHLVDVSKPVIVAVNGYVAGGGCELIEMCDIVIAAESARFAHPEITLAAMPGAGGTQRLPRVVGRHVAMDMLFTGRVLSAKEAMNLGLVSRLVPDAELVTAAMNVSEQVAAMSGPVMRRIKRCVNRADTLRADALQEERDGFYRCFEEADFREGLDAFLSKRKSAYRHS